MLNSNNLTFSSESVNSNSSSLKPTYMDHVVIGKPVGINVYSSDNKTNINPSSNNLNQTNDSIYNLSNSSVKYTEEREVEKYMSKLEAPEIRGTKNNNDSTHNNNKLNKEEKIRFSNLSQNTESLLKYNEFINQMLNVKN